MSDRVPGGMVGPAKALSSLVYIILLKLDPPAVSVVESAAGEGHCY